MKEDILIVVLLISLLICQVRKNNREYNSLKEKYKK